LVFISNIEVEKRLLLTLAPVSNYPLPLCFPAWLGFKTVSKKPTTFLKKQTS